MNFDKEFNPGTGNTYITVESGATFNHNPNATTVSNTTNIYTDGRKAQPQIVDDQEKQIRKNAILEYVRRLNEYVKEEWKSKYDTLWLEILEIPEVDAEIYNIGRQVNTVFNRNLVGNILGVLKSIVFKEQCAKTLTIALENTSDHSIRAQIGKEPSDEIRKAILPLLHKKQENDR